MSVPNVTYARACDSWDANLSRNGFKPVILFASVPNVTCVYEVQRMNRTFPPALFPTHPPARVHVTFGTLAIILGRYSTFKGSTDETA